ncbi:hypothetical protein VTK73DRAFT_5587 [Phialemonium thermophilum]|uniref:Uncharacterized protein n=1 Tax=Phialemonium thermophilum TaxID=223376 RepID=A0ABR3V1B7_9PEZI
MRRGGGGGRRRRWRGWPARWRLRCVSVGGTRRARRVGGGGAERETPLGVPRHGQSGSLDGEERRRSRRRRRASPSLTRARLPLRRASQPRRRRRLLHQKPRQQCRWARNPAPQRTRKLRLPRSREIRARPGKMPRLHLAKRRCDGKYRIHSNKRDGAMWGVFRIRELRIYALCLCQNSRRERINTVHISLLVDKNMVKRLRQGTKRDLVE